MAVIKSGDSTDQLTVDATSKAARVTMYRSDGTEIVDHQPETLAVADVTVVNNDLIASFDAGDYSYISFQLKGTWVGDVRFQASNDNGTFEDIIVQNVGDAIDPYVKVSTTNSLLKIPILAKFLRIRVTAFTSGIVEGVAFAYREDIHTGQISSTGQITIAAGQTVAEVTNVQKMGGQDVSMGAGVKDAGTQRITIATDDPVSLASGTNFIGKVSISPGSTLIPLFILGLAGAVNVNSANITASTATLRSITFTSYAATPRHFKLYDTSGVPVAGSGTPVIVCSMPSSGTLVYPLPVEGFPFTNGIGHTMTLGAANTDATPTATAPDFSVSLIYS
tara:strand:+ start:18437 stop:19441 length:1005 start_codon:yes stop_codon:yes gene_type:complete